eukprot:6209097-Pleurochrysis_carterae.AAC.3
MLSVKERAVRAHARRDPFPPKRVVLMCRNNVGAVKRGQNRLYPSKHPIALPAGVPEKSEINCVCLGLHTTVRKCAAVFTRAHASTLACV